MIDLLWVGDGQAVVGASNTSGGRLQQSCEGTLKMAARVDNVQLVCAVLGGRVTASGEVSINLSQRSGKQKTSCPPSSRTTEGYGGQTDSCTAGFVGIRPLSGLAYIDIIFKLLISLSAGDASQLLMLDEV